MSLRGYVKKGKPANWLSVKGAKPVSVFGKLPKFNFDKLRVCRPIARESKEHAKLRREYNAAVKEWLNEPQNKYCRVGMTVPGVDRVRATQCHHKHGRGWRGELTMVESLWIPVSAQGHAWIDANRAEARKLGLLSPEGQWNELPMPPQ